MSAYAGWGQQARQVGLSDQILTMLSIECLWHTLLEWRNSSATVYCDGGGIDRGTWNQKPRQVCAYCEEQLVIILYLLQCGARRGNWSLDPPLIRRAVLSQEMFSPEDYSEASFKSFWFNLKLDQSEISTLLRWTRRIPLYLCIILRFFTPMRFQN